MAGFGWDTEPDRARRLRIFATVYDRDLCPDLLVDYTAIRLPAMAAHIEQQVHVGGKHDLHAGMRVAVRIRKVRGVACGAGLDAVPAQPRPLHHVLGVGDATAHPVRQRSTGMPL